MSEKMQPIFSKALWILTLIMLVILTLQGFSGNWITFFLILPGVPANLSQTFIGAVSRLAAYHVVAGFIAGLISILVLIFAFMHRSSIYVRIFAILGLIITASAGMGGFLFVKSGFQDRWPLGQMADSLIGAYAAYFLQLLFMNKTPKFSWATKGS
jgi:hypothetical protein